MFRRGLCLSMLRKGSVRVFRKESIGVCRKGSIGVCRKGSLAHLCLERGL